MSKRILWGWSVAIALAVALIVIWWPGCGWVDPWVVLSWACEVAAGGGGSGAA